MFSAEGYEKTYQWAVNIIKDYPNCNILIWQVAVMLDSRRIIGQCEHPDKYDEQINSWYEMALNDKDEKIQHHAADSLFGFYLRKGNYEMAEKYLNYFSDYDPMKKLRLGQLYMEQEKTEEAYEKLENIILSDEIWSDLILNGHKHIPSQSISEDARQRTAAFYAPSKTFNLAGLVGSYHIVYNSWWRDRILKESSLSHYNMMNVLSMHALLGAYQPEGYEWTDELCEVLSGNVSFACDYIDRHFKGVNVSRPEGTYMLFADCTDWCTAHGKTIEDVEKACWDVGVAVQDGRMFFGPCHLRMNLASPRSRIEEAFRRMDRYVFNR